MGVVARIRDGVPLTQVRTSTELDRILDDAAKQARDRRLLTAITLNSDNGNALTIALGGEETVLSFDHENGPYFASKGQSNEEQPFFTCFLNFDHHTEFPRKYVIPVGLGINAVREFLLSEERPTCVSWTEV